MTTPSTVKLVTLHVDKKPRRLRLELPMRFLLVILLALCPLLTASAQPNIILINIDDLGYADIGPFGSKVPTPHLDRMAKEGMKLTSHYAAPVCSPSRAAMMTGCYPKRVLPIPGVLFPAAAVGLNPEEVTVAEALRQAGYATACIGKWHLGDQPEFLPAAQGFDSYFGIPYSNDMGIASEGSKSNPGQPLPKSNAKAKAAKSSHRRRNRTQRQCAASLALARWRSWSASRPPNSTPSPAATPSAPSPISASTKSSPSSSTLRTMQSTSRITRIRTSSVNLASVCKKTGRSKWTGPSARSSTHCARSSSIPIPSSSSPVTMAAPPIRVQTTPPLRGAKGSTLEGGMRVCTLAWWPGKIAAGSQTKAITAHIDWLPTFASIAGTKLAAARKIDGEDLSAMLLGKVEGFDTRDAFFYYSGFNLQAVRSGPWKLQLDKNELYNLETDIGEAHNVAADHPDQVAKLTAQAAAMKADLGDKTKNAPGIRTLGHVANPQPLISSDGTVRAGFDKVAKTLP